MPPRRPAHPARVVAIVLAAAAALVWALALSSCGVSTTEPDAASARLATPYGVAKVYGSPFDAGRAEAAIVAAYELAGADVGVERVARLPLDGLTIVVGHPDMYPSGLQVIGAYQPGADVATILAGHEEVLTAEVGHRICHQLGGGPCCRYTDQGTTIQQCLDGASP